MKRKSVTKSKKPAAKKMSPKKTTIKKAKVMPTKSKRMSTAHTPLKKAIKKKQTKSEILTSIAEHLNLEKKVVKSVIASIKEHIGCHMMKGGSGEFTLPDIGIKTRKVKKKATKARKGRNPFTGEEMMIKAKPASTSVRAVARKALKEPGNRRAQDVFWDSLS